LYDAYKTAVLLFYSLLKLMFRWFASMWKVSISVVMCVCF